MIAHRHAVDLADHVGLEHRVAEVGGLDVLREEVDLAREVLLDDLLDALHAERELPVAGHDVHAQQLGGVDHVLALGPQRGGRALPGVAAVEQQRAGAAGLQALDQRGQVREAADLAVAPRRLLEIEVGEGMGVGASRRGTLATFSRCSPTRCGSWPFMLADAEVDAGLAEVDRLQLRMAVGHVQERDVAELRHVVQRVGGRGRVGLGPAAQAHAGDASRAEDLQEFALGEVHDVLRIRLKPGEPGDLEISAAAPTC